MWAALLIEIEFTPLVSFTHEPEISAIWRVLSSSFNIESSDGALKLNERVKIVIRQYQ